MRTGGVLTALIAGLELLAPKGVVVCEKSLSRKDYGSAFMHCPVCGFMSVTQVWGLIHKSGRIERVEYHHGNSLAGRTCCIRKIKTGDHELRRVGM